MVSLDCSDPSALAKFYAEVLGWKVTHDDDAYAMIGDGGTSVGFGRVDGYQPPVWAEATGDAAPKRYHLDLYVDDLDDAEDRCAKLGATKPDFQPGERWRVMIDPGGHPFCLCLR